jgi:type I restriction enzyme S subunit
MNNLPEGWRRVSLREITVERISKVGSLHQVPVLSSTKHHGLVPSDEYFKGRKIYSEDISNYKVVHKSWFAYATNHLAEGSIGLQESFDIACVSPIYTVFSCTEGIIPRYLFRVLKSPELITAYGVHEQASVDRRGAVRYRDFGRIKVNLPPKAEQLRIASILDTLDDLTEATKAHIQGLQRVKTGIFNELLPWSPGDAAPASWSLASFESLTSAPICYGIVQAGPHHPGGVPVAMIRNLESGLTGDLHRTNPNIDAGYSRSRVRENDVLVSIKGTIGRVAVTPKGFTGNISRDVARLRPGKRVSSDFLAWLLATQAGQNLLSQAIVGTTRAEVSIGALQKLEIPTPTLSEQRRITSIAKAIEHRIETEEDLAEKLITLRQGLTKDLLTGRVRASEAETMLEDI